MRRGRTLIMVLLIIVIGLVVAFFAFRQFLGGASTAQQQAPTNVEIYVAGQNIPQGQEITEAALQTIQIPQDKLVTVEYGVDEKAFLIGKVAKYPIDQGVPITESMVGDGASSIPISGPQWASLIPSGQTAISIPIDRLSLAGYAVADGAHVNINACFLFVDIDPSFQSILPNKFIVLTGTGFNKDGLPLISLGTDSAAAAVASPSQGRLELEPAIQQPYYLIPSETQRPRMVCQILLQDVVVMKVGNFPLNAAAASTASDQPAAAPADAQAQQGTVKPDLVTLLVSPQDSITLSYLIQTKAALTMTLRNPSDQARQATEASTLQFLLSQYNIPVPAKLPYSLTPQSDTVGGIVLPNDVVKQP